MTMPDFPEGALLRRAWDASVVAIETLAPPGGLLIVVPHPDDESFGCGQALAAAADAGRTIAIVLLTDGEGSHPHSKLYDQKSIAALRAMEMRAALHELSPDREIPVLRLALPDGRSDATLVSEATLEEMASLATAIDARAIWSCWAGDPHCDHVTAARIARALATRTGARLWSFAVWGRFGERAIPDAVVLFADDRYHARKARAVAAHRSQVTMLIDDDPGGFVMPAAFVDHFVHHPEIFLMTTEPSPRRASFEALFSRNPDPWQFEASDYERDKRAATVAALGGRRFASGLEIGCATGVLTQQLSAWCDALLALDISDRALDLARERLRAEPTTSFMRGEVPDDWPAGTFDLIVLSELLYFLSPAEIAATSQKAKASLADGGICLLVNWTGDNDLPVGGDDAVRLFAEAAAWQDDLAECHPTYRIDRLRASGGVCPSDEVADI